VQMCELRIGPMVGFDAIAHKWQERHVSSNSCQMRRSTGRGAGTQLSGYEEASAA